MPGKFLIYSLYFAIPGDKPALISVRLEIQEKYFPVFRADPRRCREHAKYIICARKQYCEMLADLKSAKYGRKYVYGDLRESSSRALSDAKLFVLSDI